MSIPGTGMCDPSRNTAMIRSVKRILLRRSGTLKALTKALSTARPSYPRSADDFGRASGTFDLLPRRPRERMRANGERLVDVAAGEHLHRAALPDEPVLQQRVGRDLAGLVVLGQHLDVHHGELLAVGVLEPLQLRQATLEGHLPALEPGGNALPRAGPLRSPSGGLAAGAGA